MAIAMSDFLWRRLKQWGVNRVYGYPGDGINGLMGALHRAQADFDYVRVRHEEMSAFMAGAHAKFTGEVGVCIATSGPGAIHLLNGDVAERLGAGVAKALLGKAAVPDQLPFVTGSIGLLGTKPSWDMMQGATRH